MNAKAAAVLASDEFFHQMVGCFEYFYLLLQRSFEKVFIFVLSCAPTSLSQIFPIILVLIIRIQTIPS